MSFPLVLELTARLCLVVGSGAEAELRVSQFKHAGARVRWVCKPGDTTELADETLHAEFDREHLQGVWLAVLTERNSELALRMQTECNSARVWFCAVDQPSFNSFSHVARVNVEPISIAISSAGQAPLLSRRVREGLEAMLDTAPVRDFFKRVAELRRRTPAPERRRALERALEGFAIHGQVTVPGSVPEPTSSVDSAAAATETQATQSPKFVR